MYAHNLILPTTCLMNNGLTATLITRLSNGGTLGYFTPAGTTCQQPAIWDSNGILDAGNHAYMSMDYDLCDTEAVARAGWDRLDGDMQDLLLAAGTTKKIMAIKKTRELTGMGLTYAKYAIENFKPRYA